ncbi:flippase-like domain-containing protein [Ancylothrix sp. C2]|uniref:lysylphosphatidylglycerol synthase transmembrane domain-containing protein n=1 Tax=Ancylothrix sp. D3o TaxID=2953691 RepID=UPI0021BADD4C|nr:flippase-like domain-containing protein [Ancylothrix sp. D3o]MCT7952842.1 flippase-like domain-containing protein [Ancylothrix sp. D3o]
MRQLLSTIQWPFSRIKPYLRWVILGVTLFFLAKAVKDNWQEVAQVRITEMGWVGLVVGLAVTVIAHLWSAWVWVRILHSFQQPVPVGWGMSVYLKTNIAKYLPGNIWHFYGRIVAVREAGVSGGVAVLSVLIEPVLMAAAAFLVGFTGLILGEVSLLSFWGLGKVFLGLVAGGILAALHPIFLNNLIKFLGRLKKKALGTNNGDVGVFEVKHYPLGLLLGEGGFVLLRGLGFVLAVWAIFPGLDIAKVPVLLAGFSLAWLLGLVVPGAPGGIGIFEATAVVLLSGILGSGTILSAVAFYRLISVLAESLGWALAIILL